MHFIFIFPGTYFPFYIKLSAFTYVTFGDSPEPTGSHHAVPLCGFDTSLRIHLIGGKGECGNGKIFSGYLTIGSFPTFPSKIALLTLMGFLSNVGFKVKSGAFVETEQEIEEMHGFSGSATHIVVYDCVYHKGVGI